MLHGSSFTLSPLHISPPLIGLGLSQYLKRMRVPPLHNREHSDQEDQELHPPLTGEIAAGRVVNLIRFYLV